LITDVFGFIDVLISSWDQRSKVMDTASNEHNVPDTYNTFVNI